MKVACIPHTQIPGSSKIFLDLLYHYPRVEDLYPHPPTLEGIEAAARGGRLPGRTARGRSSRRLRRQNTPAPTQAVTANLDRLARPGTVAVATGQQVGLLGGPCFAAYKALAAIKYAAELEKRGTPAVPIFWLATEDHDVDEVSHVELLDRDSEPSRRCALRPMRQRARPPATPTRATCRWTTCAPRCPGWTFRTRLVALVEESYGGEPRFGDAFAALWRKLFAKRGLILLDPMDAELRRIAVPVSAAGARRAGGDRARSRCERSVLNSKSAATTYRWTHRRTESRCSASRMASARRCGSMRRVVQG